MQSYLSLGLGAATTNGTQFIADFFSIDGAAPSFTTASFRAGTAMSADGTMGTLFLEAAEPVPATAVFIAGIAHSQAGLRYVALWPANNAVHYHGSIAIREDGAMIIVTSGTPAARPGGISMSYRGEVIVSTSTPDLIHSGYGLLSTGALCISEAS